MAVEAVFEGLQQADAIMAGLVLLDVVIGADPGDETFVLGVGRGIAEDDDQAIVREAEPMMSVSR